MQLCFAHHPKTANALRPCATLRVVCLTSVLLGLAAVPLSAQPSAPSQGSACEKFGKPSFTALRNTKIPGGPTIEATVYVTPDKQREDTRTPTGLTTRIVTSDRVIIFDAAKKSGVSFAAPRMSPDAPKIKKDDPTVRLLDEKVAENMVVRLQTKRGEAWVDMLRVVCRADGVELERQFPLEIQGKVLQATSQTSQVEIKDIPAATFEVPAGIKIEAR
jgi:hypothetical protein